MLRTLLFAASTLAVPALYAQQLPVVKPVEVATAEAAPIVAAPVVAAPVEAAPAVLPDAPSVSSSLADAPDSDVFGGAPVRIGKANVEVAPKYAGIILPGQTSVPLSAGSKVVYGFRDAFSLYQFLGATASALISYGFDTAPNFDGNDWHRFGKKEGAAELRAVEQSLYTDAVFSPLFHDDPRYYELGQGHSFLSRVVYAGTRVVVVRNDAGHNTFNAPLILGYGATAGVNNLFYPDGDTGAKNTFENWGTSLAGAVAGFEVNEFLNDALHFVHLRK